jgi:hypothetical protein
VPQGLTNGRAQFRFDISVSHAISVNVLAARCLELSLPPTNGNPEPSSVSLKGFMRTRISLPSAIRTHVRPFSLVAPAFILLTTAVVLHAQTPNPLAYLKFDEVPAPLLTTPPAMEMTLRCSVAPVGRPAWSDRVHSV